MQTLILTRPVRPEPKHIARPGTRPFYVSHSGEVIVQATMWDLNLRELYDLLRGGRYDQFIRFRLLEGAAIYATSGYALDTNDWPTGTNLTLENRGRIQGKGGEGGHGGNSTVNSPGVGGVGGTGGNAFLVQHDIVFDNADGEVFAGGGGGGGGGGAVYYGQSIAIGGSGGGGGAGTVGGDGGPGGTADSPKTPSSSYEFPGNSGSTGGADAGGDGGEQNTQSFGALTIHGGAGGVGGAPGESGSAGEQGESFNGSTSKFSYTNGGAGGQPGNAIVQDGGTVTITGGNNSTQIKGSIV